VKRISGQGTIGSAPLVSPYSAGRMQQKQRGSMGLPQTFSLVGSNRRGENVRVGGKNATAATDALGQERELGVKGEMGNDSCLHPPTPLPVLLTRLAVDGDACVIIFYSDGRGGAGAPRRMNFFLSGYTPNIQIPKTNDENEDQSWNATPAPEMCPMSMKKGEEKIMKKRNRMHCLVSIVSGGCDQ